MGIPKKGSRKIIVESNQYSWMASGNDGYIDLIICSNNINGQKLKAQFYYHSFYTFTLENGALILKQNLVVTPFIVRQVIIYGLNSYWTPNEKGTDLDLGFLDKKIILNNNP